MNGQGVEEHLGPRETAMPEETSSRSEPSEELSAAAKVLISRMRRSR